jgi:hypothetical protein
MGMNMEDADRHRLDMMDELVAHGARHDGHADMADCWADEDAYEGAMDDHLDGMRGDMDGFDDDASCSGAHGMM